MTEPAADQPSAEPTDTAGYFLQASQNMCELLSEQFPDLHGIALVALWEKKPENLPAGLLHLRDPSPPYVASMLMLQSELAKFSINVHKDLLGQLSIFDKYAADLRTAIAEQQAQLNNLGAQQTNDNNPAAPNNDSAAAE